MDLLTSERGRNWPSAHQHWIVLVGRRPSRYWALLVLVLALAAYAWPEPMVWAFLLVVAALGTLRYRLWRAERIVLTNRRIIHIQGVLETTRTEAWLRLDRISGMRIDETFWGSLLGYATIVVEAPGEHSGLHRLYRIDRADSFYLAIRNQVFGEPSSDPDDGPGAGPVSAGEPGDYVTEELPVLRRRERHRRR